MKRFSEYILEVLDSSIRAWVKEVYNNMSTLIKNNKLKPITVNVDALGKPNHQFVYKDFINDQMIKKIISNRLIGFTVINQIVKIPNKYLSEKNPQDITIECLPYWYRPVKEAKNDDMAIDPTYFIGLILFDKNSKDIEKYCKINAIETSLCVQNSEDVLKAMITDFGLHFLNKLGTFEGLSAKPTHPKMKAILMKIGFVQSKENKEILVYKL